jgi:predicted RNase H-like nuclease (RuvC/YqgF family)
MGKISEFFAEQSIPLAGEQRKKMVALDRKFVEMETEIQALKTENLHLKAQVNPLQRQVDQLRDEVQRIQEKATRETEQPLDEKALALLLAIAQGFHVAEKGGETIIKGTRALAAYYLGFLKEKRLIRYIAANYTVDGRYAATQEGLKYLHKARKL